METAVRAMKRSIKHLSFDDSFEEKKWNGKECLCVRSAPKDKKSLCVSEKKVKEIETWFNSLFVDLDSNTVRCASRILLLTGPSGSGKTATVEVIAENLGLTIEEWNDSSYCVDRNYLTHFEEQNDIIDPLFCQESQITQFKRHLVNANTSLSSSVNQKIILVEDFPSEFLRNSIKFINIIRQYLEDFKTCVPIVFILTVSSNVDFFLQKVFPEWFIMETNTRLITLNPVTVASIVSVLAKLCNGLIAKEELKKIAETSGGDIRNAINTFEIKYGDLIKKFGISFNSTNSKNKSKKLRFSIDSRLNVSGRDSCPTFFHSLGKILYCKRFDEIEKSSSLLPQHLTHCVRSELKSNPEEIVDSLSVNGDTLNYYLHEHYLKFTSDLKQLTNCVSVMSDVDALFDKINWQSTPTWSQLPNYIIVRNLMYNLSIEGTHRQQFFSSFTKPRFSNIRKSQQEFKLKLEQSNNFILNSMDEYLVNVSPYISLINDTSNEARKQNLICKNEVLYKNEQLTGSRNINPTEPVIYSDSDDEIAIEDVDLS